MLPSETGRNFCILNPRLDLFTFGQVAPDELRAYRLAFAHAPNRRHAVLILIFSITIPLVMAAYLHHEQIATSTN